jgi:hypothetical protein
MTTQPKPILVGDLEQPIPCQLCYNPKRRMGTLIDPNRHVWYICADCIGTLWSGNQALIVERIIEEKAAELIQSRLLGNREGE